MYFVQISSSNLGGLPSAAEKAKDEEVDAKAMAFLTNFAVGLLCIVIVLLLD